MIEDLVKKELEKNTEYAKLEKEIEDEAEKIQNLSDEYQKNEKTYKHLQLFALIGQIIVMICCLFNIYSLPYYIVISITSKYVKKISNEANEEYYSKINKESDKTLKAIQRSKNIIYETYDIVEKKLQTIKNEAEHYLKVRNYDEILRNAKKYENIIPLIENEKYCQILLYLIKCANAGINSMSEIPASEKNILDYAYLQAQYIEKIQKENPKKHKTLGERQKDAEEEMENAIKEKVLCFINEQEKNGKTLKKTK